jgi:hypothetical protein
LTRGVEDPEAVTGDVLFQQPVDFGNRGASGLDPDISAADAAP